MSLSGTGSVCTESNSKSAAVEWKLTAAASRRRSTLSLSSAAKAARAGSMASRSDAAKTSFVPGRINFLILFDAQVRGVDPFNEKLPVSPDPPGNVSLGVGHGFPALDHDGVAGDRFDGLADRKS